MNALPTFDISITEGASYDLLVTLAENGVGLPLAGYSFEGVIKDSYADNAQVRATFSIVPVGGVTGQVKLSLVPNQTAGLFTNTMELRETSTAGVWDAFYTTPAGARVYMLGGKVRFKQTATKAGGL